MSVSHFRVSRLEQKVGISATKMFIFSAPCPHGGKTEFSNDDFLRLAGRERQQGDMVVVIKKFYDPLEPILTSPVELLSASELRDEVRQKL